MALAAGPYLVLVAAGLALLPGFAAHLTTDGVSYLSIADHIADSAWPEAVNAYWSPFFSWSMAPLLALGAPWEITAKLVQLAVAVCVLFCVRRLMRLTGASAFSEAVVAFLLVPFLAYAAFVYISPDLLVAIPVLACLCMILQERGDGVDGGRGSHGRSEAPQIAGTRAPAPSTGEGARLGAWVGFWVGVGYLAKLFALPFFVVHLTVIQTWRMWRERRSGTHVRSRLWGTASAVAVGATVIGAWAAVLSATYEEPTIGTAGAVNVGYVIEGSPGAPQIWGGLLEPPNERAISSWEDPARAQQVRDEVPVLEDARSDDPVRALPSLLGNVAGNLSDTLAFAARWWPPVLLAVGLPALGALSRRARRRRRTRPVAPTTDTAVVLATAAMVWTGGLLLTIPQHRYHWVPLLVVVPLAALALDRLRSLRNPLPFGAAVVAWGVVFLSNAVGGIQAEWRVTEPVVQVAESLDEQADFEGVRIASSGDWGSTVGICARLGCRYLGTPREGLSGEELAEDLRAADVDWYIVRGDPPEFLGDRPPVARVPEFAIRVHEVP